MPVKNLLDTDYYKFTMGQIAFYNDVAVRYEFQNRTAKKLIDHISVSDLKYHLDRIQSMYFTHLDLDYLESLGFGGDYLNFLSSMRLPSYQIEVTDDIHISVEGMWSETIYWETLILATINELINIPYESGDAREEGLVRLYYKIQELKKYPDLKFVDFGTRRRFDRIWQDRVLWVLKGNVPSQLLGTSNVDLARELNLNPVGTFAHELIMVQFGLYQDMEKATNEALKLWEGYYGTTIALSDTFGTDFFLKAVSDIHRWDGLRQDSGDPFVVGEKILDHYRRLGINTRTKTIVFSDGLDIDTIIALWKEFSPHINVVFGWGTNLMNDLGNEPWSIVMKVVKANGVPVFKLSDNPDKSSGPDNIVSAAKEKIGYEGMGGRILY